jgi:hypothetical protein
VEWSHCLQKKKYATLQDELFWHSQQLHSSLVDHPSGISAAAHFESYHKDSSIKQQPKKPDVKHNSFRDSK